MRKYVILSSSETDSIVFDDLPYVSTFDQLFYKIDRSQFLVKFEGDTPSWLEGKTVYNNEEILAILDAPDSGWRPSDEDP
jgi:hypothetical protein|tara:strand:+ start:459 stop:698 length:240 start_codon:yes stop_codon:yes gene_type:complete